MWIGWKSYLRIRFRVQALFRRGRFEGDYFELKNFWFGIRDADIVLGNGLNGQTNFCKNFFMLNCISGHYWQ